MQTKSYEGKVSSTEYLEQFLGHERVLFTEWHSNFTGQGISTVLALYKRSVENRCVCYDPFILYEHNSSYSDICKGQV